MTKLEELRLDLEDASRRAIVDTVTTFLMKEKKYSQNKAYFEASDLCLDHFWDIEEIINALK